LDSRRAAPAHGYANPEGNDEVLRQLHKQAKRELRQAHRAHKKKRAVETKHGQTVMAHTQRHALKGLHAEGKAKESIHALHDKSGQLQTETIDKLKAMQAHYKAITLTSRRTC
jgi:hypothetical protein